MTVSRAGAWPYAEQVLSRPARRVAVVLRRSKSGTTLLHQGRALTRCYDTGVGRATAALMAQMLGARLPGLGESVRVVASTGVLYRVISVSSLDPRSPEARMVIERLVEEASDMAPGAEEDLD